MPQSAVREAGRTSLKGTFDYAINNHFQLHTDRHALKLEAKAHGIPIQQATMDRFCAFKSKDFAHEVAGIFSKWARANAPEIHRATDVTPAHWNHFLSDKALQGVQWKTITSYASAIHKLGVVVSEQFHTHLNWGVKDLTLPHYSAEDRAKLRDIAMERSDWNAIIAKAQEHKGQAVKAMELNGYLGLRNEELSQLRVRDVNLEKGEVFVDKAKGGRGRTVKAEIVASVCGPRGREILVEQIKGKGPDDPLFVGRDGKHPIRPGTIQQQFRDISREAGITKYIDKRTNQHAVRKMVAREYLQALAKQGGLSREDIKRKLMAHLGHFRMDQATLEAYVEGLLAEMGL